LTRSPSSVENADLETLREQGLDDRAIVDLNQVVAYFNYVNRIAEGLGVDWRPAGRKRRASTADTGWPIHRTRFPTFPQTLCRGSRCRRCAKWTG